MWNWTIQALEHKPVTQGLVREILLSEVPDPLHRWVRVVCDGWPLTVIEVRPENPDDQSKFIQVEDLDKWCAPGWFADFPRRSSPESRSGRLSLDETSSRLADFRAYFVNGLQRGLEQQVLKPARVELALQGWHPLQIGDSSQGVLATPLDLKLPPQQQAPAGMCAGGLAEPERTKQPGPVTRSDALLSKYRSAVKRAILIQLTQNPRATDSEICRGLDADGSVELPEGWRVRPQDRLFFDAYSDAGRKHNVETAISKVRQDLRKKGLLGSR